ncbi:MAG: hypothetical protein KBT04_04185, partial [Bacteroidales bacterium]|nr:hypothetical protein [Candidatus Colimorpha onthohippi]
MDEDLNINEQQVSKNQDSDSADGQEVANADIGGVSDSSAAGNTISLNSMFRDYWIDYASDAILDR